MSEIKHTPLPWKMVSAPNFDNGNVYTSVQPVNVDEETMKPMAMMNGEHHVCRMSHTAAPWRFEYHRANAAFIVEACNSYYENCADLAAKDAEIERLRCVIDLAKPFVDQAVAQAKASDNLSMSHILVPQMISAALHPDAGGNADA